MTTKEWKQGDRVRVRKDCPHTLPHYARVLVGAVIEQHDDGMVTVRFSEDQVFPVQAQWLERAYHPSEE